MIKKNKLKKQIIPNDSLITTYMLVIAGILTVVLIVLINMMYNKLTIEDAYTIISTKLHL